MDLQTKAFVVEFWLVLLNVKAVAVSSEPFLVLTRYLFISYKSQKDAAACTLPNAAALVNSDLLADPPLL